MSRYMTIFMMLSLCVLQLRQTQAQTDQNSNIKKKDEAMMIVIKSFELNDRIFNIEFEIINNSKQDVWICDDVRVDHPINSEVYLADDNQNLIIRRRLDLPSYKEWIGYPHSKYILLRPGKKKYESLSINVPVKGLSLIFSTGRTKPFPQGIIYFSHVTIEIGYYEGNLPDMIFKMLEDAETTNINGIESESTIITYFGGVLKFNSLCEELRQRDEEILIPYTYEQFKGEKILSTVIDGLHVPYEYEENKSVSDVELRLTLRGLGPDLSDCTKIEVNYQPSVYDWFFPYDANQSLFSRDEIEYLQSLKTFIVDDQENLRAFTYEIKKGVPFEEIVREEKIANVNCYSDNNLTSFTIYDNIIIENEERQRLRYQRDLLSTKMLTSKIQQFEYRVHCAANLKNLWYRLHFYNKAEAKRLNDSSVKSETIYPISTQWCDASSQSFYLSRTVFVRKRPNQKTHICPSGGECKCHYAMNPNCQPNSPGDMVLLFETKAGWNQHGGPELFTFDNHDPKGDCVLLNDGTVKFIRTNEELNALRWK